MAFSPPRQIGSTRRQTMFVSLSSDFSSDDHVDRFLVLLAVACCQRCTIAPRPLQTRMGWYLSLCPRLRSSFCSIRLRLPHTAERCVSKTFRVCRQHDCSCYWRQGQDILTPARLLTHAKLPLIHASHSNSSIVAAAFNVVSIGSTELHGPTRSRPQAEFRQYILLHRLSLIQCRR
jgi:hypothetical protein